MAGIKGRSGRKKRVFGKTRLNIVIDIDVKDKLRRESQYQNTTMSNYVNGFLNLLLNDDEQATRLELKRAAQLFHEKQIQLQRIEAEKIVGNTSKDDFKRAMIVK